jgi:hypothetical protein
MPYSKEAKYRHERLREPSEFQKSSFRTVKRGKSRIVIGRLKGEKKTTAQAILRPKHSKYCFKCHTHMVH